jgi:catechol 2,3-dioxygenase-like lactoylglutathione lyase family enzyme
MKMRMARIILFTGQIEAMSRFYAEVLGLRQVTDEKGWKEFAAGGVRIALHSGRQSPSIVQPPGVRPLAHFQTKAVDAVI